MRFSPIVLLLFAMMGCGLGSQSAEQYADDIAKEISHSTEWEAATTLTDEEIAAQTVVTDVIERLGGKVSPYDSSDFNSGIKVALNYSLVTDDFLKPLKLLVNLRSLYLNSTKVTDDGLGHLKELNELEVLLLYDTKVTEAGVKELQIALPHCKIIY